MRQFIGVVIFFPFVTIDIAMTYYILPGIEYAKETYLNFAMYESYKDYLLSWKNESFIGRLTKQTDEAIENRALPAGKRSMAI